MIPEEPQTPKRHFTFQLFNRIKKSTFSFWPIHLTAMTIFIVLAYLNNYFMWKPDEYLVLRLAIRFVTMTSLLALLRKIYLTIDLQSKSIIWIIIGVLGFSVLLALANDQLHRMIFHYITCRNFLWYSKLRVVGVLVQVFWDSITFICWSGAYFTIKFWIEWNDQKLQTVEANAFAQKAEIQMLRYQMNPHFLFNSLNSIRALISENKKNAKTMVTELSEFLRYSLLSESYTEAPLSHEIEAIHHYYAIEKKRFEDRLEITFDITPQAEEFQIISFLIHPLVENAVKYGMRTSPMPLKIHITASADDHRLSVSVCNTGKWIEPSDYAASGNVGTGTGLENVRKRLVSSYPNRHTFEIEAQSDCVAVKFEIWKISGGKA